MKTITLTTETQGKVTINYPTCFVSQYWNAGEWNNLAAFAGTDNGFCDADYSCEKLEAQGYECRIMQYFK